MPTDDYTSNGVTPWTIPAGVSSLQIETFGTGGAGGSADATYGGGGGGGGGYAVVNSYSVTPGQQYDIVLDVNGNESDPYRHASYFVVHGSGGGSAIVGSYGGTDGTDASGAGGAHGSGGGNFGSAILDIDSPGSDGTDGDVTLGGAGGEGGDFAYVSPDYSTGTYGQDVAGSGPFVANNGLVRITYEVAAARGFIIGGGIF